MFVFQLFNSFNLAFWKQLLSTIKISSVFVSFITMSFTLSKSTWPCSLHMDIGSLYSILNAFLNFPVAFPAVLNISTLYGMLSTVKSIICPFLILCKLFFSLLWSFISIAASCFVKFSKVFCSFDELLVGAIGVVCSIISLSSSLSSIYVLLLLKFSGVRSWFSSFMILSVVSLLLSKCPFSRSWANCTREQCALMKNPPCLINIMAPSCPTTFPGPLHFWSTLRL